MLEEEGGNLSLESGIQRTGLPGETGVGREQGWQSQEWSLHMHRVWGAVVSSSPVSCVLDATLGARDLWGPAAKTPVC